eukprot:TRINITY_DN49721_c0_g1_i1.p1 TRINITY_DN49721_c0_g1~~TRINITY_DN49721_c0_g1_i1.p1  ORF type:complete len:349 (+),score=61.33 TRINITY_DN49721_c0_g1_i1:123-1169(+)
MLRSLVGSEMCIRDSSEELKGVAESLGVSLGKVAMLQIAYEVFAGCTSIVVDMDQEGSSHPFHIRTMDWDLPGLQEITIQVEFVRKGRTVFKAATWPGYVGVLTGMRPGGFSVSINYRRSWEAGNHSMIRAVLTNLRKGLFNGAWPVSFLVREVLDRQESYEAAVGAFESSGLMAPTYITVGGMEPGEGCVITRTRSGHGQMPVWKLSRDGAVVQANMDWFRDDPGWQVVQDEPPTQPAEGEESILEDHSWQDISWSSTRRIVAQTAITSAGERLTKRDLWLLLSTPPCQAEDLVYTTSMCASTGEFVTRSHVREEHEVEGYARWSAHVEMVAPEVYGGAVTSGPSRQ